MIANKKEKGKFGNIQWVLNIFQQLRIGGNDYETVIMKIVWLLKIA